MNVSKKSGKPIKIYPSKFLKMLDKNQDIKYLDASSLINLMN